LLCSPVQHPFPFTTLLRSRTANGQRGEPGWVCRPECRLGRLEIQPRREREWFKLLVDYVHHAAFYLLRVLTGVCETDECARCLREWNSTRLNFSHVKISYA